MEHIKETAYWAGRLIGYDQAWEVAKEIVEAIEYTQNQALQQPDVSGCSPLDLAQAEYRKLLDEEYEETVRFASAHGWKSSRVEQGKELRKKIEELKAVNFR